MDQYYRGAGGLGRPRSYEPKIMRIPRGGVRKGGVKRKRAQQITYEPFKKKGSVIPRYLVSKQGTAIFKKPVMRTPPHAYQRYGGGGRKMIGRGVYRGYFKRGKVKGASVYARKGVMTLREDAGVIEQDKCVYVGHATHAPEKVLLIVLEACLRWLAKRAGLDFHSTLEVIGKQLGGAAAGATGEFFWIHRS